MFYPMPNVLINVLLETIVLRNGTIFQKENILVSVGADRSVGVEVLGISNSPDIDSTIRKNNTTCMEMGTKKTSC